MANNTRNVTYGKPKVGGSIYVGPTTISQPKNATTTLGVGFKNLGYVSEDGLTNSNSPESETIKAWGGDTVLVNQTGKEDTFTFTLIEVLNVDVLKEVYGEENVTGTLEDGIEVASNNKAYRPHTLVIEMVLNDALRRIVLPKAVVSEIGDIEYKDDSAVGYELTVSALPDEQGNTHYEYTQAVKYETEEDEV